MSRSSVLSEIKRAVRGAKTETGQRSAVMVVLAKHGSSASPIIKQAKARSGAKVRLYIWRTRAAGDFVLTTGASVEPVVERLNGFSLDKPIRVAGGSVATDVSPRSTSVHSNGAREEVLGALDPHRIERCKRAIRQLDAAQLAAHRAGYGANDRLPPSLQRPISDAETYLEHFTSNEQLRAMEELEEEAKRRRGHRSNPAGSHKHVFERKWVNDFSGGHTMEVCTVCGLTPAQVKDREGTGLHHAMSTTGAVRRLLQTHGPSSLADLTGLTVLPQATVKEALRLLVADGDVRSGREGGRIVYALVHGPNTRPNSAASALPVVFRREKAGVPDVSGNDIVAVFPTERERNGDYAIYAHLGQHGTASPDWIRTETRPARPDEYGPLLRELKSIYERGPDRHTLVVKTSLDVRRNPLDDGTYMGFGMSDDEPEPVLPEEEGGEVVQFPARATREEKVAHQDSLDAMFQERIYAVRNALKEMGWSGWEGQGHQWPLEKGEHTVGARFDHVGAGRNIVGVTYVVDGERLVPDITTVSPETIAKAIDIEAHDPAGHTAHLVGQGFVPSAESSGFGGRTLEPGTWLYFAGPGGTSKVGMIERVDPDSSYLKVRWAGDDEATGALYAQVKHDVEEVEKKGRASAGIHYEYLEQRYPHADGPAREEIVRQFTERARQYRDEAVAQAAAHEASLKQQTADVGPYYADIVNEVVVHDKGQGSTWLHDTTDAKIIRRLLKEAVGIAASVTVRRYSMATGLNFSPPKGHGHWSDAEAKKIALVFPNQVRPARYGHEHPDYGKFNYTVDDSLYPHATIDRSDPQSDYFSPGGFRVANAYVPLARKLIAQGAEEEGGRVLTSLGQGALVSRTKRTRSGLAAPIDDSESEPRAGGIGIPHTAGVTTYTSGVELYHNEAEGTVAKGDTRPVKEILKKHGFRWYKAGGFWYIPRSRGRTTSPINVGAVAEAIAEGGAGSVVSHGASRPPDSSFGTGDASREAYEAEQEQRAAAREAEFEVELRTIKYNVDQLAKMVNEAVEYGDENEKRNAEETLETIDRQAQRATEVLGISASHPELAPLLDRANILEQALKEKFTPPDVPTSEEIGAEQTKEELRNGSAFIHGEVDELKDLAKAAPSIEALRNVEVKADQIKGYIDQWNRRYVDFNDAGHVTATIQEWSRQIDRLGDEVEDILASAKKAEAEAARQHFVNEADDKARAGIMWAQGNLAIALSKWERAIERVERGEMSTASSRGVDYDVERADKDENRAWNAYPSFYAKDLSDKMDELSARKTELRNRQLTAEGNAKARHEATKRGEMTDAAGRDYAILRNMSIPGGNISPEEDAEILQQKTDRYDSGKIAVPIKGGSLIFDVTDYPTNNNFTMAKTSPVVWRGMERGEPEAFGFDPNARPIGNTTSMVNWAAPFARGQIVGVLETDMWPALAANMSTDTNRYGLRGVAVTSVYTGPKAAGGKRVESHTFPENIRVGAHRYDIRPTMLFATDGSSLFATFLDALDDIAHPSKAASIPGEMAWDLAGQKGPQVCSLQTDGGSNWRYITDRMLSDFYEEPPRAEAIIAPILHDANKDALYIDLDAKDLKALAALKLKSRIKGREGKRLGIIVWTKKGCAVRLGEPGTEWVKLPMLGHLGEWPITRVGFNALMVLQALNAIDKGNGCSIVFTGKMGKHSSTAESLDPALVLQGEKNGKNLRSLSVIMPMRLGDEDIWRDIEGQVGTTANRGRRSRRNVGMLQPGSGGLDSRTRQRMLAVPGPHEDMTRIHKAQQAFRDELRETGQSPNWALAVQEATEEQPSLPTIDLGQPPIRRRQPDGRRLPVLRANGEGNVVANTVLRQLGGTSRLTAMIGAKNYIAYPDGVSFRFSGASDTTGEGVPNLVKIVLDPSDTYSLKFLRVSGTKVKPIADYSGIYFDGLKPLFERTTGLYLTLANPRKRDVEREQDQDRQDFLETEWPGGLDMWRAEWAITGEPLRKWIRRNREMIDEMMHDDDVQTERSHVRDTLSNPRERIFSYPQDGWNAAIAKRDALLAAGFRAWIDQNKRNLTLTLKVAAQTEQEIAAVFSTPTRANRARRAMREFPDPYGWEPDPQGHSLSAFARIPAKLLEKGDVVSVHHNAKYNHAPLQARDLINTPVDAHYSTENVTAVVPADYGNVLVTLNHKVRVTLPGHAMVVIRELAEESPEARASRLRSGRLLGGGRMSYEERERIRREIG